MPILQHHDCTHSCLPLPRINETAPMQDFHYKVDAAIKLDVIKTSSYSSDAKNHSRLQFLQSPPREGHNPAPRVSNFR